MSCPLCDRIALLARQQYPYVIHEFEHSYLVLGEHQFYPGYCVLITKNHYREMTDLPAQIRDKVFHEMMLSSKAIELALKPKKMNLCSLGNVVDHVHWHFFPRFGNDPLFTNPPWLQMQEFDKARVTPQQAAQTIENIKNQVLALLSVNF
jgi:diadenosine tetraphosphate (Ap4A) HIT family hydrolase